MLRVSALYASQDDAWFDFEYYRNKHFPMVLASRAWDAVSTSMAGAWRPT